MTSLSFTLAWGIVCTLWLCMVYMWIAASSAWHDPMGAAEEAPTLILNPEGQAKRKINNLRQGPTRILLAILVCRHGNVCERKRQKRCKKMQSIRGAFAPPLVNLLNSSNTDYYSLFLEWREWEWCGTKLSLRLGKTDFKTYMRVCVYIPFFMFLSISLFGCSLH